MPDSQHDNDPTSGTAYPLIPGNWDNTTLTEYLASIDDEALKPTNCRFLITGEAAERFNHMHLALTSIVLKTEGLLRNIEIAGLSDVWAHRVNSIHHVATYAVAGLAEPVYPVGPPNSSEQSTTITVAPTISENRTHCE